MAIFMKLLVISIVAKRRFGFWSIFWMICIWRDFFSDLEFNCSLVKEKKATSEPEINPEVIKSNISKMTFNDKKP